MTAEIFTLPTREADGTMIEAMGRDQARINTLARTVMTNMVARLREDADCLDQIAKSKAFPFGIRDQARRDSEDLYARADSYAAIAGRTMR